MSFEVTVLGSGAAVPTAKRNPTSHYVVCNDRHILIDCGEGTQMQIRKFGIKFQRISHILITHLHGDHFFGLVGLLSTMHLMGRDKGITVYGPPELENIVRSQLEIGGARLDFDVKFISLNGKDSGIIFEDRLIEIYSFPLKHRILTNGFIIREKQKERPLDSEAIKGSGLLLEHLPKLKRGENVILDNGKVCNFEDFTFPSKPRFSYAFCSDTVYTESIVPHIKGVTVLYHEATFTDKDAERAKSTYHSTATQAARIAAMAGVQKLYLGHLSARYENAELHLKEAQLIFDTVQVVEDGLKITVSH
ncbi:MAG: ribonuclease Z [Flavobacteriia bacterium]